MENGLSRLAQRPNNGAGYGRAFLTRRRGGAAGNLCGVTSAHEANIIPAASNLARRRLERLRAAPVCWRSLECPAPEHSARAGTCAHVALDAAPASRNLLTELLYCSGHCRWVLRAASGLPLPWARVAAPVAAIAGPL